MSELLASLNKQQQEAVQYVKGPVLLLAGAGSGKTRVVTHRIAYLIDVCHVSPRQILAITFTNKAAREMKERVHQLVNNKDSQDIWISTFHSFCLRLLRIEGKHLGLSNNFTILDTDEQVNMMKQVLAGLNIDPKILEPKKVLWHISQAKNHYISADDYLNMHAEDRLSQIAQCYVAYQKKLKECHCLDFDDLLFETVYLLEHYEDIREKYKQRFQYIHVDEYQDTNYIQYLLIRYLTDRDSKLCVVGDIDQSIYGWRGAEIKNILNFEQDYHDVKVLYLDQNYRSTQHILSAANDVIQNNLERKEKNLWTDNPKGEKIVIYEASHEREEAQFVIEQIIHAHKQGRSYSEMCILYRTNAQSRVLEELLLKTNIPYHIIGGFKFYERKEIKDILAYLQLIANPQDLLSFLRVVNVPKRGIGHLSLEKLQLFAEEHQMSLLEAALNSELSPVQGKAAKSLTEFAKMIARLKAMSESLTVTKLVTLILKETGYKADLIAQNTVEAQTRLENLEEFLSVTQAYDEYRENEYLSEEEANLPVLIHFLNEISLVSDIEQSQDVDQVTLMTLHAAKGLEFPIVFIVGMEEGVFPLSRAQREPKELEEERRLAYVGITRAEEELYLSYARQRTLYGRMQYNSSSRFISEIDPSRYELIKSAVVQSSHTQPSVKQTYTQPKERKVTAYQNTQGEDILWQVGDKVAHKSWGEGTLVKITGSGKEMELDIAFAAPQGIKRVMAAYAPIEKIMKS